MDVGTARTELAVEQVPQLGGDPAPGVQREQQHRLGEYQRVSEFTLAQRPGAVPVHVKDPDERGSGGYREREHRAGAAGRGRRGEYRPLALRVRSGQVGNQYGPAFSDRVHARPLAKEKLELLELLRDRAAGHQRFPGSAVPGHHQCDACGSRRVRARDDRVPQRHRYALLTRASVDRRPHPLPVSLTHHAPSVTGLIPRDIEMRYTMPCAARNPR